MPCTLGLTNNAERSENAFSIFDLNGSLMSGLRSFHTLSLFNIVRKISLTEIVRAGVPSAAKFKTHSLHSSLSLPACSLARVPHVPLEELLLLFLKVSGEPGMSYR